ncbi:fused MFS/spermidine synthase [Dactylosporangium fulvum]|uniref:Fused MFS/spermidine synthase n=1 Tax=Dactylosporangium fulvum TaxID=53359 RepID=A0ABY5VX10_9ACTN|nr:fused MFS/spermidine synthase [Dactylosporangium fulvum]UWP82247.1 fused MFS/spermidine synthase [Dactylosporangium fulvum]
MGGRKRSVGIVEQVDGGVAELCPDDGRPDRWTLLIDGYPQSAVDLADPRRLDFEYMRRIASVVDAMAPVGAPLSVLHLGGGALTMPRYVAATRPGSTQRVVELDAALIVFVRRELPLPRGADIRVRAADARAAVASTAPGRFDLVIADVYSGARVPAHLASREFLTEAARVLRPDGLYVANLADGAGLAFARGQAATLCAVFPEVVLLAEPSVLRGRRFGNVVLVASPTRGRVPVAELARAAAADPFPARLVDGEDLAKLVGAARVVTDATATPSPAPPANLF